MKNCNKGNQIESEIFFQKPEQYVYLFYYRFRVHIFLKRNWSLTILKW